MPYTFEHLAGSLKKAREKLALSQRALGTRTGLTQAQISRIENADVDPRASTLIELARALELELVLVPRDRVPLVRHVLESGARTGPDDAPPRALYTLDDDERGG